jgi:hypothetical protein
MIVKRILALCLFCSSILLAQGIIDTYAGNDSLFMGSGQP